MSWSVFMFSEVRGEVIVSFVDISEIDDHQSLNLLTITSPLTSLNMNTDHDI
jgi:hypothetical protein